MGTDFGNALIIFSGSDRYSVDDQNDGDPAEFFTDIVNHAHQLLVAAAKTDPVGNGENDNIAFRQKFPQHFSMFGDN